MKFCIYMATCACMASVLLAEDAASAATSAAAPVQSFATNAVAPAAASAAAPVNFAIVPPSYVAPAAASAAAPADENADEPAEQAAVVPGFERFKTIMDRNPFGRPPPGFDPDAPGGAVDVRGGVEGSADAAAAAEASVVEQQIISSVRVSMLNVTPSGKINVGFTDSSVQPPRNYLMEVGEKREGCEWQVVEADPEKLTVKLSKEGVEATLKLGGGSGAPSDAKKEGEEVAKAPGAGPVPGSGMRPGMPMLGMRRPPMAGAAAGAPGGATEGMSGLDIARARRQERIKQMQVEAEQQRQAAEQAKREREQERREREQAAEERKAQLAQLMQIQEELRRQREEKEKLAEAEAARQAAEAAPQHQEPQD